MNKYIKGKSFINACNVPFDGDILVDENGKEYTIKQRNGGFVIEDHPENNTFAGWFHLAYWFNEGYERPKSSAW